MVYEINVFIMNLRGFFLLLFSFKLNVVCYIFRFIIHDFFFNKSLVIYSLGFISKKISFE